MESLTAEDSSSRPSWESRIRLSNVWEERTELKVLVSHKCQADGKALLYLFKAVEITQNSISNYAFSPASIHDGEMINRRLYAALG